jgi:Secretory lipase
MHCLATTLLSWSILSSQTLAFVLPQLQHNGFNSLSKRAVNYSALLPVPSQDPFFVPADGWEDKSPGDVLKLRKSAYKTINIGNVIDTFQVQFRSTDTNNNASWATTTVFIPASHEGCSTTKPELCSHGMVTFAVPYDSADPDATPSYLLQYSEPYGEIFDLTARGYFVNVPDYEGPQSSYCAGVQAGHAMLDSAKAVLKVAGEFGFRTADARSALWGYSGGASATEFAAELHGSYAPDLKLAAVINGGTCPSFITASAKMNGKDTAGLVVAGIIGITKQQPVAQQFVHDQLNTNGPYNATGFYSALGMNGNQVLTAFENQNLSNYFKNGDADLTSPVLQSIYNSDATMGRHGIPLMPQFTYKAIEDEMSAASETDAIVNSYCEQGANILYHRNRFGGHNEEMFAGRPRALAFLSAALDGTDAIAIPRTGCQIVNVTDAVLVNTVNTIVREGAKWVVYPTITVTPTNVTLNANGSASLLEYGKWVLIDPYVPNKRSIGIVDVVKRWSMDIKGIFTRSEENTQRTRLDALAPKERFLSPGGLYRAT